MRLSGSFSWPEMALPFLSPLSDGVYHFLPCVGVTWAHGISPLLDTVFISLCLRAASTVLLKEETQPESERRHLCTSGRASQKRGI